MKIRAVNSCEDGGSFKVRSDRIGWLFFCGSDEMSGTKWSGSDKTLNGSDNVQCPTVILSLVPTFMPT